MTEMFGEAWPPMSAPDLAPDDDDDDDVSLTIFVFISISSKSIMQIFFINLVKELRFIHYFNLLNDYPLAPRITDQV